MRSLYCWTGAATGVVCCTTSRTSTSVARRDSRLVTAIEAALSYPEESAGRLMSRDFVAVPEHMTVGHLIDFLREEGELAGAGWNTRRRARRAVYQVASEYSGLLE